MEDSEFFPKDEEWIFHALFNLSKDLNFPVNSSSEDDNFVEPVIESEVKDFLGDSMNLRIAKEVINSCQNYDQLDDGNLICGFCNAIFDTTEKVSDLGILFCSQKCKKLGKNLKRKRDLEFDDEDCEQIKKFQCYHNSPDCDFDDETYSPDEIKKSPTKSRRISSKKPRWTSEEDAKLIELKRKYGDLSWAKISQSMADRTSSQCYQRWHRVLNPAILKGPWSKEETDILSKIVSEMDKDKISWSQVAKNIPGRTDIQCRYQYLKLIRSGKQKLMKKNNLRNEERRNPQRMNRKRSSSDEIDSQDSENEIQEEGEEEIEI